MANIYTNTGLVRHAEKALALKTKYMWGGILRPITKEYITVLKSMYGTKAGTGYTAARYAELEAAAGKGCYGVDCVGLIKSYYWSGKPDGGTGSPNYGKAGFPDVNAGYMYQTANEKGRISGIPEIPGLIVYSKTHPHVGIYIGGGYTIESTLGSRGDGVVKRKLDSFWEYWFKCLYIVYNDSGTADNEALKIGDKVTIKTTAVGYAGVGSTTKIPESLKGEKRFTISKVSGEMSLLKEIYSWVNNKDLIKV